MKKIIFGLIVCMTLSSFGSNANINRFENPSSGSKLNTKTNTSLKIKELIFWLTKIRNLLLNTKLKVNDSQEAKLYLNDPTFKEFGKNLIIFDKVMNNPRTHPYTILGKGNEIFSDSNNKFFSSESTPSDLRGLYSNALNAWEKIEYEENLKEKLDDFKKKIVPLVNMFQPNLNSKIFPSPVTKK